jgi:hypothetical protein
VYQSLLVPGTNTWVVRTSPRPIEAVTHAHCTSYKPADVTNRIIILHVEFLFSPRCIELVIIRCICSQQQPVRLIPTHKLYDERSGGRSALHSTNNFCVTTPGIGREFIQSVILTDFMDNVYDRTIWKKKGFSPGAQVLRVGSTLTMSRFTTYR